ncbi:MAG: hypothetical protein KC931_26800, partial [Candidatus Omnitrophica bacterium]|nr:hypothetical protein [Candidatus Omnitrophota bacterium]
MRPLKRELQFCREAEARLLELIEAQEAKRQPRSTHHQLPPQGRAFDLNVLGERVRDQYFEGAYA